MTFWRKLCGILTVVALLSPLPARPDVQQDARAFAIAMGALCSVDESGSQIAHDGFCTLCLTASADPTPERVVPAALPLLRAFSSPTPANDHAVLASRRPTPPARAPPVSSA